LPDGRIWISSGRSASGAVNTWATYARYTPVQITVSGGNPPYAWSLVIGSGQVSTNGLFLPSAPGTARVRATDTNGLFVEAVVQVQ
jgi:hypothetical protein